jgi:hypothetical protein
MNWDDFNYVGEENDFKRKVYLHFCIQCGPDYRIRGTRYKLKEVFETALLVEKSLSTVCKICNFPLFTSCNYKRIPKSR